MIDLNELRRLAQEAMPGPWRVGHPPPNGEQTIGTLDGLMVAVATTGWAVNAKLNAEYVAAANPATVLELLDEIERLRAASAKAKEALYTGTMDDFEVAEMLGTATQGGE